MLTPSFWVKKKRFFLGFQYKNRSGGNIYGKGAEQWLFFSLVRSVKWKYCYRFKLVNLRHSGTSCKPANISRVNMFRPYFLIPVPILTESSPLPANKNISTSAQRKILLKSWREQKEQYHSSQRVSSSSDASEGQAARDYYGLYL